MKSLLKVMLTLGGLFALTFFAGNLLGIFTIENVQQWLEWAQRVDPLIVFGLVVLLLFADLFIAVPTLTITILAGLLIGFPAGALAALTGMSVAAASGYWISRFWGQRGIAFLIKDPNERASMIEVFQTSGPAMILLSRAAPIVTEVTACMAGATKMPFLRYCMLFGIGTIPYALIAAYAGSISSIESPQPAILAVIALNATLWVGWFIFKRRSARPTLRRV